MNKLIAFMMTLSCTLVGFYHMDTGAKHLRYGTSWNANFKENEPDMFPPRNEAAGVTDNDQLNHRFPSALVVGVKKCGTGEA